MLLISINFKDFSQLIKLEGKKKRKAQDILLVLTTKFCFQCVFQYLEDKITHNLFLTFVTLLKWHKESMPFFSILASYLAIILNKQIAKSMHNTKPNGGEEN